MIGGAAGYRPRVRSAYYERVYVHSPRRNMPNIGVSRREFKGHLAQSRKLTHDAISRRIKPMTDTQTVSFTQMKDGTKEDYELLEKLEKI